MLYNTFLNLRRYFIKVMDRIKQLVEISKSWNKPHKAHCWHQSSSLLRKLVECVTGKLLETCARHLSDWFSGNKIKCIWLVYYCRRKNFERRREFSWIVTYVNYKGLQETEGSGHRTRMKVLSDLSEGSKRIHKSESKALSYSKPYIISKFLKAKFS